MAEIHIDQSHCNYFLVQLLVQEGWTILFTDPGRVSRGGTGPQGDCLRVFELHGLHIPDVVAVNGEILFIIEIDSSFKKSIKSLVDYRDHEKLLLEFINSLAYIKQTVKLLELGFCKIGITKNMNRTKQYIESYRDIVDYFIGFIQPRKPVLYKIT